MEIEVWKAFGLFLSHYILSGLTALFLMIKMGEGISLKTLGTAGFYSLIGGTFAPVMSEFQVPLISAVEKTKLSFAYAAGIGGGIIAVPKLTSVFNRILKNWTEDSNDNSSKET